MTEIASPSTRRHYFVMGYIRDWSLGSRMIGFIPHEALMGRPASTEHSVIRRDGASAGRRWRATGHRTRSIRSTWLLGVCAVPVLMAGCGDSRVTLRGADGLALSYDCADPTPQARTAPEQALVREYAVNAIRDARNRDRLAEADTVITADGPVALELAVVRYMCTHGDVRHAARRIFPESGSVAEDFELVRHAPEGGDDRVRLEDLRGKVVVLNFWATWCGPCRDELPELHLVAERYREQGVVVYGVLHRDDPAAAAAYLREIGVEIPLLLDPDYRVATRYRVRGLPYTYIIGRDGRVFRSWPGYGGPESVEDRVRKALES